MSDSQVILEYLRASYPSRKRPKDFIGRTITWRSPDGRERRACLGNTAKRTRRALVRMRLVDSTKKGCRVAPPEVSVVSSPTPISKGSRIYS